MKIALLSVEYPPNVNGGLGRYIEKYMKYMLQHGHYLWVFTINPGDLPVVENETQLIIFRPLWKTLVRLAKRLTKIRYLSFLLRFVKLLSYNFDTYRLIKKQHPQVRFDIIAVHDWMSGLAGILCALTFRIPIVFHVHNTEFSMTTWGRRIDRFRYIAITELILARKAQKIIVSSAEMCKLVTGYHWNRDKIAIIHHGYEIALNLNQDLLPLAQLKAQIQFRCKIAPQDKILLFVGRLNYAKGIFNLISAMVNVVKIRPDVKLIIIGTGDDQAIEFLIRGLSLTEHIFAYYQFLNFQEVMGHYQVADLCVFPSLYEPFGLVALEAMSFGKPVILGAGFPEVFAGIPENPPAMFVEGNHPEPIAAAILELLQDPINTARMGETARKFVQNNFSWNRTFEETLTVYHQAIKKA